jgi:hypothetical protein
VQKHVTDMLDLASIVREAIPSFAEAPAHN